MCACVPDFYMMVGVHFLLLVAQNVNELPSSTLYFRKHASSRDQDYAYYQENILPRYEYDKEVSKERSDYLTMVTTKHKSLKRASRFYRKLKDLKANQMTYVSCPEDASCAKYDSGQGTLNCDSEARKSCPSMCGVCIQENVCCYNKNSGSADKYRALFDSATNKSLHKPKKFHRRRESHSRRNKDASSHTIPIGLTNLSRRKYVSCKDELTCSHINLSIQNSFCNESQRKDCPSLCKVCLSPNICCKTKYLFKLKELLRIIQAKLKRTNRKDTTLLDLIPIKVFIIIS